MKRKKIKSYAPRWPMRAFVLFIALLVSFFHILGLRTGGIETIPLPMLGLILLMDAILLWWGVIFTTQSRVTLFDEGIELERGASKVFTTWDNVSHLGIKGFGRNRRRGIFLHSPVKAESQGLIERLFFGWESNFIPIGSYVHLPSTWSIFKGEINKDKLLETDFGQDLYELAPHLFDEEKPKNRLTETYEDDASWQASAENSAMEYKE